MYRTVESSNAQAIYSTNSLAIGSVLLAVFALVAGLSPILQSAFLPISLLGMILAVFSLFSCRDRTGLQVGALAVNGFVMLLALLMGPRISAAVSAESMPGSWGSMTAVSGSQLDGQILDRTWTRGPGGGSKLGLAIAWNTDNLSGSWNWIDGVVRLSHLDGDEVLELDWRVSQATMTSSGSMVRSDEFLFDHSREEHRWLTSTANNRIKVEFLPTQWEHVALQPYDGRLRPAHRSAGAELRLIGSR